MQEVPPIKTVRRLVEREVFSTALCAPYPISNAHLRSMLLAIDVEVGVRYCTISKDLLIYGSLPICRAIDSDSRAVVGLRHVGMKVGRIFDGKG